MATPATVNTWLDQLSSSFIVSNPSHSPQSRKQLQDAFRRRVKRHNYARTNQFEVAERLDGLEEKFQILSLDSLSDALRSRRKELKDFEHHWLPDALDLFLHLSGDPARNERLLELYRVAPRIGTPPPLTWKDVIAADPIDKNDRLWRVPDFRDTDDSSYEDDDDDELPSPRPALSSVQQNKSHGVNVSCSGLGALFHHPLTDIESIQAASFGLESDDNSVGEEYFLRELLITLRGLSSPIFAFKAGQVVLQQHVRIHGLTAISTRSVSETMSPIRQAVDIVHKWISTHTDVAYFAAMKDAATTVLRDWYGTVDRMQQDLVKPIRLTSISVIRCTESLEENAGNLLAVASFLIDAQTCDPVTHLEKLYEAVQRVQTCGYISIFRTLCSILVPSLQMYLEPIQTWLNTGKVSSHPGNFLVQDKGGAIPLTKLWHERFAIRTSRSRRNPHFLNSSLQKVFICGKTSAFLNLLGHDFSSETVPTEINVEDLSKGNPDIALPFAAAFENQWLRMVDELLRSRTQRLKLILATTCGFEQTLDALEQIYLGRECILLDDVEPKLFDRIDWCMDNWNDRFQLRDMLAEAFKNANARAVSDVITVHSAYTSSRTMQSRRSSVKILNAVAFEYILSWPIANIIDEASMTSYRRISLMLLQIRRAKYCIVQTGYLSAMRIPLEEDSSLSDQKFAQVLAFRLITFVHTVLDHFMATTIEPLTRSMRKDMHHAPTMDKMIEIHRAYIHRLENSCLSAPRAKILRQSLIAILDLCIRFSDLVSNPAKARLADADHEASSFMSAMSRGRALRADQYDSDSEDDLGQLGEGYSSFVVLEDDTSIVKELRKVEAQFDKQLKFFVAGLSGISKAGEHVSDLQFLAERLIWTLLQ